MKPQRIDPIFQTKRRKQIKVGGKVIGEVFTLPPDTEFKLVEYQQKKRKEASNVRPDTR
jgi:hypothetical protein